MIFNKLKSYDSFFNVNARSVIDFSINSTCLYIVHWYPRAR